MRYFKQILILLYFLFSIVIVNAQTDIIYAAPITDGGSEFNSGAIDSPWDLQTALNNVMDGQTLYLRGGQYNGRYYTGGAHGTSNTNPITVISYPGEWAVLNANSECVPINSLPEFCGSGLYVDKDNYRFENFEITLLDNPDTTSDDFSRFRESTNLPFVSATGIRHHAGTNCKFYNLVIHNMTSGMFTSKGAGGTEVYGCLIYNNGFEFIDEDNNHGFSGTGLYIQNATDLWKNATNNVFFNNFKSGSKLWANERFIATGDPKDLLKNLNFHDNVILNTGSPTHATRGKECFIIGGRSQVEGEGIVHDVNVTGNFMYHNPLWNYNNDLNAEMDIVAEVFRIGSEEIPGNVFYNYAQDIVVTDNYFIGKKLGVDLVRVESLVFKRNFVRTKFMYSVNNTNNYDDIPNSTINKMTSWDFDDNTYFSVFAPYGDLFHLRILDPLIDDLLWGSGKRKLSQVNGYSDGADLFFETTNSTNFSHNSISAQLGAQNTISITQNLHKTNRFKIVVFDKNRDDVIVNLAGYDIPEGTPYTIRDAENYFVIIEDPSYIFGSNEEITVPMDLPYLDVPNGYYPSKPGEDPLTPDIHPKKTIGNVGVFIVDFGEGTCIPDYVLEGTETVTVDYIASNSITTAASSTTYNVLSSANITHKAGSFIHLKNGTHIQSGSNYYATIEDCNVPSNRIAYVGEKSKYTKKEDTDKIEDVTSLSKIIVSPNPTSNSINIRSSEDMASLNLMNVFGEIYFAVTLNNSSSKKTDLDLSKLTTGMYFLRITLKTGEIITKQIVKK